MDRCQLMSGPHWLLLTTQDPPNCGLHGQSLTVGGKWSIMLLCGTSFHELQHCPLGKHGPRWEDHHALRPH